MRKLVTLVLTVNAIGLLLLALVSRTWWGASGDPSVSVGLTSVESCDNRNECKTESLSSELRSSTFALVGDVTVDVGIATILALVLAGIVALGKTPERVKGPRRFAGAMCGLTMLLSIGFVAAAPSEMHGWVHIGAGLGFAIVGGIAGVLSSLITQRVDLRSAA